MSTIPTTVALSSEFVLRGISSSFGSHAATSRFFAVPKNISLSERKPLTAIRSMAVATEPAAQGVSYISPTWAEFESGKKAVYCESVDGGAPASGKLMTVWFNPGATNLVANDEFGISFSGCFNSFFMCISQPRTMTKKQRGPSCTALYSIKVNVPVHAKNLEFTLGDGTHEVGPFSIEFVVPKKWERQDMNFFNENLQKEMQGEGVDETIYPDSAFISTRCLMPGGVGMEEGASCALDIVPGCTDIESPFYDPLATVDNGSCPIDEPLDKNSISKNRG